jgi:hypothetical protein
MRCGLSIGTFLFINLGDFHGCKNTAYYLNYFLPVFSLFGYETQTKCFHTRDEKSICFRDL